VVRASPARGALALGASAVVDAGVAAAVVAGARVDATLALYLAFFGLCAVVGLWMLMAPARLVIGPEGVTERVLGATKLYRWSEVYDFRPAMIGLTSMTVGFSFTAERPGWAPLRRLNQALSGVPDSLNAGWEVGPLALAELLNASRERWLDTAAARAPRLAPPIPEGAAGARMNRKVFATAWALLAGAAGALTFVPQIGDSALILVLLFGARLNAARLHDIGVSGWWQLALYAAQGAAAATALAWRAEPEVTLGALALLQLAFTAALTGIPGDPAPNHFGPAPGQATPLVTAEAFR